MLLVSSKRLGQLRLMCAGSCGLVYGLLGKRASRRGTRVDRCVWGVRMGKRMGAWVDVHLSVDVGTKVCDESRNLCGR